MSNEIFSTELLVVGAGPAGLSAAVEAASAGVRVLVVDDNLRAGGQIFRQLPSAFRSSSSLRHQPDFRKGHALLAEAEAAGVEFRFDCTVWSCFETGVLDVSDGGSPGRIRADRIVIAAGAHDRPVPLPGWTLPGVFTVGGAQALLKSQRLLPGNRMLLAGVGPLLLVVASQLAEAGVRVVGVAEPVPALRALTILPALAREWPLLRDGIRYRRILVRHRVPWFARSVLVRIEGSEEVAAAWIARVDTHWHPIAGTERRFEVDAVATGYGLQPSIELPRLCGCAMRYDEGSRSWIPVRTVSMESTVPGIYVVGDGAGVAGAVVAAAEGRVAGIAAAHSLGRLTSEEARRRIEPHDRRLRALERFRRAVERVYEIQEGLYSLADPGTLICRCEEVSLRDLEEAVSDGADSPAVLKSFTRCGMGSCQARMCGAATAEFLASRLRRSPGVIGLPPAAPPAKPVVTLEALATD